MTVKVSALPEVTTLSGSALVMVVQDGVSSWASASLFSGSGGGAGGGAPQMVGNVRRQEIDDLLLETETKLGGFTFDPSLFASSTAYLSFVGTLTNTGSTPTLFELRLYDMGAPNTPQAGDLRASIAIDFSGALRRERFPLTASNTPTSPGTSPDDATIYDTERIYEIRGYLTGGVGDLVEVDWAGIQGG